VFFLWGTFTPLREKAIFGPTFLGSFFKKIHHLYPENTFNKLALPTIQIINNHLIIYNIRATVSINLTDFQPFGNQIYTFRPEKSFYAICLK